MLLNNCKTLNTYITLKNNKTRFYIFNEDKIKRCHKLTLYISIFTRNKRVIIIITTTFGLVRNEPQIFISNMFKRRAPTHSTRLHITNNFLPKHQLFSQWASEACHLFQFSFHFPFRRALQYCFELLRRERRYCFGEQLKLKLSNHWLFQLFH